MKVAWENLESASTSRHYHQNLCKDKSVASLYGVELSVINTENSVVRFCTVLTWCFGVGETKDRRASAGAMPR